jgi:hypothetical protein
MNLYLKRIAIDTWRQYVMIIILNKNIDYKISRLLLSLILFRKGNVMNVTQSYFPGNIFILSAVLLLIVVIMRNISGKMRMPTVKP